MKKKECKVCGFTREDMKHDSACWYKVVGKDIPPSNIPQPHNWMTMLNPLKHTL